MRFSKSISGNIRYLLLALVAFALYLPTLRTGFLTDDFLDCNHSFAEVPAAFSQGMAGGYRPLMVIVWAMDNALWGITGQWGWHLTNLFVLAVCGLLIARFLKCFVNSSSAVIAGLSVFVFSYPIAVAVGRVSWRTTLIAMIPFLLSTILAVTAVKRKRTNLMVLSAFLYLVSLLFKETFLAGILFIAMAGAVTADDGKRKPTFIRALVALIPALAVYGTLRYLAMGTELNYSESGSFGFFMLKNLVSLSALFWKPWLTDVPIRVLAILFPITIFFANERWLMRGLILSGILFLLLPVSNLAPRPDLAVAASPGITLMVALGFKRYGGRSASTAIFTVLLIGMMLNSRDELKILRSASDSLNDETGRIASILDETPGRGPVFFHGIVEEFGGYGTFWPGEYGMALACTGYETDRTVTDTQRMWEILVSSGEAGFLIFTGNGRNHTFSVSSGMYSELPDTLVQVNLTVLSKELLRYPSCMSYSSSNLGLYNPVLSNSVIEVEPILLQDQWYYDLAAQPIWLARDPATIILFEGEGLTFTSRNLSLENSRDRHSL